jgi:Flp pilus assembly protein TadG
MGLFKTTRRFARDNKGLAAIEFGFISLAMGTSILNTADLANYSINRMQVENAAQMGVQAAWQACDLNHLPATVHCAGLNTAVSTAIQRTSLGAHVTLAMGSPAEGYYCLNLAGTLQYVADAQHKPADCTAAGVPVNTPSDYLTVQTTYTFTPLFPSVSVASVLPATITRTAWMRMG